MRRSCLPPWAAAEAGQVGVLTGEAGRGRLAAGVGVAARVEHQRLDRSASGQDAGHRAEADVERCAVPADGEDRRHQRPFGRREVPPRERGQFGVMDLGVVAAGEFELRDPQRAHFGHQAGDQSFVDADGQRLGVLEQAVDPRVEVRRERHGGGVHAGAAGGVRDHRGRRPVAGRTRFVQVQPSFELGERGVDPVDARASSGQEFAQSGQPVERLVEDAQVLASPVRADPVAQRVEQVDGGDFATAPAGAVTAGHRVVILAAEQDRA